MKLHTIIRTDSNAFHACGPAAIAAITGMGTAAARDSIKQAARDYLGKEGRRIVSSTNLAELLKALELYGYKHSSFANYLLQKTQPTLARVFLGLKPKENSLWLIRITEPNHFLVSDGKLIVDNSYPAGVIPYEYQFIDSRCTHIYQIEDISCEDL